MEDAGTDLYRTELAAPGEGAQLWIIIEARNGREVVCHEDTIDIGTVVYNHSVQFSEITHEPENLTNSPEITIKTIYTHEGVINETGFTRGEINGFIQVFIPGDGGPSCSGTVDTFYEPGMKGKICTMTLEMEEKVLSSGSIIYGRFLYWGVGNSGLNYKLATETYIVEVT